MRSGRGWIAVSAALMLLTGCSGGDELREGERGSEEFALVAPASWVEATDVRPEAFELALDHPDEDVLARLGVARVQDLNDVRAYVMDTSVAGAALRGLEPDILRESDVEVEGAQEARLVEFTYTAAVEGEPRVRTLQLAVRRDDDLGFDLRVEALEDSWDEVARDAERAVGSFRLRDP